jgi:hypothetical protein
MAIGLTLHLSLRKTSDLQADRNLAAELREARLKWWADHQVAVGAFCGLMLLLSLVSYSSARVVIALVAIVAHALCAETLSSGRRASRQAIATTAFAIGWTAHTTAWFAGTVTSGASGFLSEGLARQGPHGFVLELAVTAWSSTLLGLASVQGRSRFLRPWRLMIKGTHLDIAKLVFTAFAPLATLGLIAAIWFYARSLDGSVGKQLWDSRASLAWFAFCIHALILVKRAPVVRPDESPSSP